MLEEFTDDVRRKIPQLSDLAYREMALLKVCHRRLDRTVQIAPVASQGCTLKCNSQYRALKCDCARPLSASRLLGRGNSSTQHPGTVGGAAGVL
jgi:hypothetical protein